MRWQEEKDSSLVAKKTLKKYQQKVNTGLELEVIAKIYRSTNILPLTDLFEALYI